MRKRFTPLAQSLAPTAAVAQVGGALRLFSARTDFAVDVLDGFEVRSAAPRLAADLGARLRSYEQAARSVTVMVRMADRTDPSKARTLVAPSARTDDTDDLRHIAYGVLDGFGLQRSQLTLDGTREARLRVEPVIERLNTRYGPGTTGPAAALAG
ncbi:hypothetical protein [Streptomyces sp. NPDC058457]|uniref:DinB/UmuC family translesion DNA polymerase n=1 Tax=Streptomyces sp. NPDC058457 TaxID=3346507 RepID=UPI003649D834